jgi:hypothetical protein
MPAGLGFFEAHWQREAKPKGTCQQQDCYKEPVNTNGQFYFPLQLHLNHAL